jgi:hypothetical protein
MTTEDRITRLKPRSGGRGKAREEAVGMLVQERVNIIMAELNGEIAALLNDLDRGVLNREQATRILGLTVETAKHEIMAVLPLGAPREISYRAG